MLVAWKHDNCSVLGARNEDSRLTERLIAALLGALDLFFCSRLSLTLLPGVGLRDPSFTPEAR